MTDKVQKIRKEVEKIAKSINPFIPDEDGKNSDYEAGKLDVALKILQVIDTLQEEPVSEDLEEAGKEWLRPQLDKTYANYGEAKMMELTRFDGYAMLDAIEFGAKWQKQKDALTWQDMKEVWSFGDDLPPMAEEDFFQEMLEHINKRRYESYSEKGGIV